MPFDEVRVSTDELKAELPPQVLSTFYGLNGTDRQLAFFVAWRKRGFSRGSKRQSFIDAGYAPKSLDKNAYRMSAHPAIMFLYHSVGNPDIAKAEALKNKAVDRLNKLVDSQDPYVQLKTIKQIMDIYKADKEAIQKMAAKTEKAFEHTENPHEMSVEELIAAREEIDLALVERKMAQQEVR